MSAEYKDFDPRVIGSITSGILLLNDFGKVHEAIEWIMGFPVWTHELPSFSQQCAKLAKDQFSGMPMGEVANWQETADFLLSEYGPAISVLRGRGERDQSPIASLEAVMATKGDS